jgi:hypothetical protein
MMELDSASTTPGDVKMEAGTSMPIRPAGSLTLLSLPYDDRVAIYKAAFVTTDTLLPIYERAADLFLLRPGTLSQTRISQDDVFDSPPATTVHYHHPFNINLLRACKTIYNEALPILYTQNKFIITAMMSTPTFNRRISGKGLAMITDLQLRVEWDLMKSRAMAVPLFGARFFSAARVLKR